MPEAGNIPIPTRLLQQGVRDMVRISDARMSGTAYGTVVLHVAPESAIGGPLALVQDGDWIELDVANRSLTLDVPDEELARRRAAWTPPARTYQRGWGRLYVDQVTQAVDVFPLPADRPDANLNTAAFDGRGVLWFTGQNGIYGSLDPETREMRVFDAPRGRGPYGITSVPGGGVVFSSLAGSYIADIDIETGALEVLDPPTAGAGARRVWADGEGRLWVSEWNAGQLAMYDPASGAWREWPLPGEAPQPYAVFVDETDAVWVTDFGANALHRFDPASEAWTTFDHESAPAEVRQLLGRPGEVWGAESAADQLVVVRRSDG